MSKTYKIVGNDISDGYHTFDELYEHRILLFVALCQVCALRGIKTLYKKPEDGFGGWFVVYLELPSGQISYHLPGHYLPLIERFAALDPDHLWDGHTSSDTLGRLAEWVGGK